MSQEARRGRADLVTDLWDQQSVWSQAANRAKSTIYRARVSALILISLAAVFAAVSPMAGRINTALGTAAAIGAATCLAFMPLVRQGGRQSRIQNWLRLRSVSEALKSEVYTYLAGASPYDDYRREEILRQRTDVVIASGRDLFVETAELTPISRAVPAVHDVDSYIDVRLTGQINGYYRPQARIMRRRARTAEISHVLLAVAAATLGVLASYLGDDAAAWLGVIATVSAAITAHAASNRYTLHQLEYLRTAQFLQRLVKDTANRDDLVSQSEQVISVQNEGWMAEMVTLASADPE